MLHKYDKYWDCNGQRIIECIDCGFRHVFPFPEGKSITEYYDKRYYSDIKPFDYEALSEDSIMEKADAALKNTVYEDIFNKVVKFKQCNEMSMIDIGSGNDLLALYFRQFGWEACVIEPNLAAAGYLKGFGLRVINDYIENIPLGNLGEISFINVQFVLEHLKDPFSFLETAYRMLSPGGIIRVCVPNDFSEGQLAYKEYYNEECRWIFLPDHINYFSFESLDRLVKRTGFREVYRTTNFPLEMLLMAGMNYYSDEKLKGQVGRVVSNFENSLKNTGRNQILDKLYECLSEIGFGRSIYMYAIKD